MPLYVAFLLACLGLMLIPGPNVTLIVATSLGQGVRRGLLTVAGTSSGMALQLAIVSFGLAQALGTWSGWFGWLRWAGAAYLVLAGIRQFRAAPATGPAPADRTAARDGLAWARGLLVATANPKTLIFLAAFLPQFIAPGIDPARQLPRLAAGYLVVAALVDCGWVLAARRAKGWLDRRARLANRLSGGLLIGCGAGLALVRES